MSCQNQKQKSDINLKPSVSLQKVSVTQQQINFDEIAENSQFNKVQKNLKDYSWQKIDEIYQQLPKQYQGQKLVIAQNLFVTLMLKNKENRGCDLFAHQNLPKAKEKLLFYISEYERLGVSVWSEGSKIIRYLKENKSWQTERITNLKNMIIKEYEKYHNTDNIPHSDIKDADFQLLLKS
ncbi:MAG: hypothetical protein EAZ85_00885 [Bacteroidetes bacterium]|nr:MAG: hypothetical protein EAZ85_00885 [Bacteroidota bacterium]TAG86840.1 MAG: hypothetical protein EAZ20_11935 [Bacteroidota bacterium]